MNTWKSRLTRNGQRVEPRSAITLSNGTKIPAVLYEALLDGYVGMMRAKGLINEQGKFNPRGALDQMKLNKFIAQGRQLAAEAQSLTAGPGATPVPSAATMTALATNRPNVPLGGLPDLDQCYKRRFGDPDWVALDVSAAARVVRNSNFQMIGAQLDIDLWLWEIGCVPLFRAGSAVVVSDYYDAFANAHMQVLNNPRWSAESGFATAVNGRLAPPEEWRSTVRAWNTIVWVLGDIPVEIFLDLTGTADVAVSTQAQSRWNDLTAANGVLKSSMVSQTTRTPGLSGMGASFGVRGGGEIEVSVDQAIDILSQYAPWIARALRIAAGAVETASLGLSTLNLGKAGVSINLELGNMQLAPAGSQRLDFLPTVHNPGTILLQNYYEMSGNANIDLALNLLPGGSIEAYFNLEVPVDVDIDWEWFIPTGVSIDWEQIGESFTLWSWETGTRIDVPLIRDQWSKNIGPGSIVMPPVVSPHVVVSG